MGEKAAIVETTCCTASAIVVGPASVHLSADIAPGEIQRISSLYIVRTKDAFAVEGSVGSFLMLSIPDHKRESNKPILSGSRIPPSIMALIPNRHWGIKTFLAAREDQN